MLLPLEKIGKIFHSPTFSSLSVDSFVIDSRKACSGSIFFALPGANVDGHDFIEDAALKGAYAAVVSKSYKGFGYGLVLFFVEDVTEALQMLARVIKEEKQMRVIGVTGSVGKTTTKEMIYQLLSKKYKVHANKGSQNTQLTLPITILEAKGDEDFLLLEMGMTEKGQIKKLVSIASPEIIVLTEIAYVHSENFPSLDAIAEAKAEIFTSETKFAVIHKSSASFEAVYRNCLAHHVLYPTSIPVISPYKETHFTENFSAAYEVAKYVGMDDNQIRLAALSMVHTKVKHRFEKIESEGILFIDDSYNASALSVIAALRNISEPKEGGRKIFVFGDMKELGKMSVPSHLIVANEAVKRVDIALCIGKDAKIVAEKMGDNGHFHYEYRALKDHLFKIVRKGDVVLIKGSNSHKLWHLLDKEKALSE